MPLDKKIIVNGKGYDDISEVPDEYKVMFKDENQNGLPDFVEGILTGKSGEKHNVSANYSTYVYNGQTYNDINQLPPEAKRVVEKGLNALGKTGMNVMQPALNKTGNLPNNVDNKNGENVYGEKTTEGQVSPGFPFRVIMTIILFILAVIYIIWLSKLI